jgi:LPS export ABC transporter protein LptC
MVNCTLRYILPAILFIAFIAAACSDLSEHDTRTVSEALSDSLFSVTESWDVRTHLAEDGRRIITLESPYTATFERYGRNESHMKGPVSITAYDSLGAPSTLVFANNAIYHSRDTEFEFEGDVVVINLENENTLRTEFLRWFYHTRHMEAPGFVTIVSPADSIAGEGLTGNDDLSEYRLRRITGQFQL